VARQSSAKASTPVRIWSGPHFRQTSLSRERDYFNTNNMPKIIHWLGLAACIVLIISCFLPWAYYADINKTFTGFFSEQNEYGKPGVFLTLLTIFFFVFMLLPKVWAKRTNLFLGALEISYGIKTFVLFSSCYNAYCPEKRIGIYLMLFSTIFMMLAAIFPAMQLKENTK
jgi:hypothetical protein